MCDYEIVRAPHEPDGAPSTCSALRAIRFNASIRDSRIVETSHESDGRISEAEIQQAAVNRPSIQLKNGERIVLIQSGAVFPDDAMMKVAEKQYTVLPLSGIRERKESVTERSKESIAKTFRLAAARGGAKTMVVYWGILESGIDRGPGKAVSWVPVVGRIFPDQSQHMRIRIKAAVIDVSSGKWELLTPRSIENQRHSARVSRAENDQEQVRLLKEQSYVRLFEDLVTRYQ